MISSFLVTKDDPKVRLAAIKDVFEDVKVSKVVSEKDTIPMTIKRVLGDKFYELDKIQVIEGIIQNECIFESKYLKDNQKNLSFFAQALSNVFQGYMGLIGNTATKEAVSAASATFCISSTSDNYTEIEMTLYDLGEIAEYINGVPMTLKNYKEIAKLSKDIEANQKAIQNAPDQETYNGLQKRINESFSKLMDNYHDIVSTFFKIIKDKTGIDVDNIVDITLRLKKTTAAEDGTEINVVSFVMMHSAYNILKRELEDNLI